MAPKFTIDLTNIFPKDVDYLEAYIIKDTGEIAVYLPFLGFVKVQSPGWEYNCPLVTKNIKDMQVFDQYGNKYLTWFKNEFRIQEILDIENSTTGRCDYDLENGTIYNIGEWK
jgi:hypothetical protein